MPEVVHMSIEDEMPEELVVVFNYCRGSVRGAELANKNATSIEGSRGIALARDPTGVWPAVEQIPMSQLDEFVKKTSLPKIHGMRAGDDS